MTLVPPGALLDAASLALVGIVLFLLGAVAIERGVAASTIGQLRRRNPAVAVLVLSVLVGLAIILSAAIRPGS